MKIRITQLAKKLGISVQAVDQRIKVRGITPSKDKETGWRYLTERQAAQVEAKK